MANKNSTPVQNEAVKELVVNAHFVMRSFKADDGDRDFLSFELIDAFKDEDFRDIVLKAKWDKYDEKTGKLVRPDRVFGRMSFYAKKALRTAPEVPVKVTIKAVKYPNKKTKKEVTYAGIFAEPTFVELEDEGPVELVVKNANDRNIFEMLAGQVLGIKITRKDDEDDPTDIGLKMD